MVGVAFRGNENIAKSLIEAGADPDHGNRAGQTASMMAALFGREPVINLLLKAGANPAL